MKTNVIEIYMSREMEGLKAEVGKEPDTHANTLNYYNGDALWQ